jgi:predicted N-acetyltransferase YhbS
VLSLVALDVDKAIIGHIAISTITAVRRATGTEADGAGAVLINPLVVQFSHQHLHVGSCLVQRALDMLSSGTKGRFEIAFVQGPPSLYVPLGFDHKLADEWSTGLGGYALMAKYLREEEHGGNQVSRRVTFSRDESDFDYPDE